MKTEILISCDDWENRVAVLEEGSLAEIYFEREEKVIGSIYKGRVENVLPGMGACFVNIGLGRNAFLYVDDIMRDPINIGETEITDRRRGHTVSELLKVGSEVLVQIVKEPRGLKGARVSTNVSLPGRYLVLMPTGRYSGVSSRIEDERERERLKQIMRRVRPEGMATIVRTAAQGVSEAELIADLGVQLRLWHGILESYKRSSAPALLHKDLNLVFKAVRDFLTSDVSAVYIDSKEQFEEIRSTMSLLGPQYIDRLKLVEGPGTLFAQRGIDEELQKLLKPKISLPSGGHLVLEHTEALTVIDVNTGKFTGGRNLEDTIVRTNIEAAAEVARQVRLRDIGGIIVVDFIDMTHERSREQVIQTLTEALRRDRTRSTIQEFSNLGLLEFTRKRVGKDLAGQLRSDCPYCGGLGNVMSSETVAIGVLRQIRNRLSHNGTKRLDVVTDPGVATQLLGWYKDEFEKLARDYEIDVALYVEPGHHREQALVEESRRMRPAPMVGSVVEAELLPVRLPNPASGVAEMNGYLIEVADAANATGQRVKLKIASVDGNLMHADLAEPLVSAGRRRRGQRGRGKDVVAADAPIAPPAPSLREIAAGDGERTAASASRTRPERPRRAQAVAFSVADDEEAPRTRVSTPRSAATEGRSARGSRAARSEQSDRAGRRGMRGRRQPQQNQPLVVGGEGDIDYDDGDEDSVTVAPPRRDGRTEAEPPGGESASRRRRRRRGRGGKGRASPAELANGEAVDETQPYGEEGREVRRGRPAQHRGSRGERVRGEAASPYEDEESEDDLSAVVDPRQSSFHRPPKRYGPVRQLYGRPVTIDESHQRERSKRVDERAQRSRQNDAGDLDVVVKPKGPAAIHVEMRPNVVSRRRVEREAERDYNDTAGADEGYRRTSRPAGTDRQRAHRGRRDERERERGDRERERVERSERPRFGGRARGRTTSPKREGPTVRQLYPPPGSEPALDEEAAGEQPRVAKPGFGRQARGPLMRPSDAPPVPKGKVRQLYPPPPEEDLEPVRSAGTSTEAADFDVDDDASSLFISDAQELDERKRRARERAEARRRSETADGNAGSDVLSDSGESKPYGEAPEGDEWPVF